MFNTFFGSQCNVIVNESVLSEIVYKTDTRLTNIIFSSEDLSKIIKRLNPNKAHGHDQISIKMIQICGDSIILPLGIIFHSAIKSSHFPDSWKKVNTTPVYKKDNENIMKNYRPISLLPIF